MLKLPPTLENVYKPEYWEPVPPMHEYTRKTRLGKAFEQLKLDATPRQKIDKATRAQAEELLVYAGSQLLAGEPLDRIEEGEVIGGPEDTTYGVPGAVLLIDQEKAAIKPDDGSEEIEIDERLSDMKDEADISRNAISAFMSGLTSTKFENPADNYAIINPFDKRAWTNKGLYERCINLVVFCFNVDGDITNLTMPQWRNEPGGPKVYTTGGPLGRYNYSSYSSVGETKNRSVMDRALNYERIREAHICLRGNMERAKAPSKQKKTLLSRILSPIPHH